MPTWRSLLPFLQRTGSVDATLGLRGTDQSSFPGPATGMSVGVGPRGYVGDALMIRGGFSYDRQTYTDLPDARHFVVSHVGAGLRTDKNLLALDYEQGFGVLGGSFQTPEFGALPLSDLVVVDDWVTLRLAGTLLRGGARGSIHAGFYLTHELGLGIGAFGSRASHYTDSAEITNRFGGSADIGYWITPRVSVGVSYDLLVEPGEAEARLPLPTTVDAVYQSHVGALMVLTRF